MTGNVKSIGALSSSFDHAPWAVTELSGETHIVRYANPAFCRLIGKSNDEVIGRPFDGLAPQTDECLTLLDRVYSTGTAASYTAEEQAAPCPLFFSYTLWPVKADGRTAGVMIQVTETGPLHETRQAISQALLLGALRQHELVEAADSANVELQAEIGERRQLERDANMLTNEVSHRVKNNLQVVVALLANEIRRTPAPWVQGYQAMQHRIMAIAHLYDLMSQSSRGHTVALDTYLTEIAKSLSASLLGDTSGIRIAVEAEALEIDSERAVPFGLLVNELGTNAVKHAFPGGVGLVTLAVRRIGNEGELSVTDDGIGLPAQGQTSTPGKHGADYVAIFVRQLRGVLVRSGAPGVGTTVSIRFPLNVS
ncbi:PAS domain-containing protein [Phenylobacterium sp. LH3H17]|uniref:PAS domain-containing sensor histidine kinase n=1 Tax=Phenylobacterium sp. LH3H17 TaxID=2903901 RepID=UPI0020C9D3DA|nr:PAS domain-containing sensor histidine kinase [Phenylobacterium sp. LH3H17]UTP41462.1 PAS domain-containing protein [Phenylobacterium sp. LH3H17]